MNVVEYIKCLDMYREPAPFGSRQLISVCGGLKDNVFLKSVKGESLGDLPVCGLYGLQNEIMLPRFPFALAYPCSLREALFALDGVGWTYSNLEYFKSHRNKGMPDAPGFLEFKVKEVRGSKKAVRGISVKKYGNRYHVVNAKHRTVAGVFYLYHKEGKEALLRNVLVEENEIDYKKIDKCIELLGSSEFREIEVSDSGFARFNNDDKTCVSIGATTGIAGFTRWYSFNIGELKSF